MSECIDISPERSIRAKPLWPHLLLTSAAGAVFSYGLVKSPPLGIVAALGVLLITLWLGLGMKNFVLLLILTRINLDAFHNQLNIPLSSYKTSSLPGVLGIIILCIGALYLLAQNVKFWKYPLVKPFGLFFLGCLLSLRFSGNLAQSMAEIAELLSFVVLFVLIVDSLRTRKDIRWMVKCLVLSSLVPVSVGLVQICSNLDLSVFSLEPSFRVSATLTHPNPYAFYLVMITLLVVSVRPQIRSGMKRIALLFLLGLLLTSLIFTYTRSAWFGLLLAVLAMGLLRNRKLLLLAPLVAYGVLLTCPFIFHRLVPLFNLEQFQYTSLAWRIRLWEASMPYFLSKPIFGNGFGTFQLIGYRIDDWFAAAHNDYLRLLVETGIVGTIGYLILLLSLARLGVKTYGGATDPYSKHVALGFVCFLLAYVVMSFADNIFGHGGVQWYFWAYAGVVTTIHELNKKDPEHGDVEVLKDSDAGELGGSPLANT